ncbi:MAG: hypothetical protein ABR551_13960 [Gemmatimonadales bacterium]
MNRRSRLTGLALALLIPCTGGCDTPGRAGLTAASLGAMVDSLLPPIAAASGLEVRRPVRYALQSQADARSFLEAQLDEELGGEGASGMERAYKAFGLLPDTLDLRALMLELLMEQVVGYYDPATDHLYVVEGVAASTAGPVVAHELVHALQDQWTDLDSLVAAERGNDRRLAAQAAAEGQAMLVMLALQAAESTGQALDPGALPDLGPMMRPALEAENERFPVFQRSPRLIRETLIFPYTGGASFVQALFRHHSNGAPPVPFGDLLPQSTEQVLEPERAFLGERDVPTEIELGAPGPGWEVVYSNTLGQLEAGIFLVERTGNAAASASGWDGDRYALLEGPGGAEALVWYTVWDDEAAAERFVRALGALGALGVDPAGLHVTRSTVSGRPVVQVVLPRNGEEAGEALPSITRLEEVPAL